MYLTPSNERIADDTPYTGSDGTRYPANFPKSDIAELSPFALTDKPPFDPMTQRCDDVTPLGGSTQVWEVISLSAEQIAANQAAKVEQDNTRIKADISALEAGQARAVREVALGGDNTRLTTLDTQIATLRSQLK